MGIWLCRTNLTASDGSEVWLMDSEGFFGPGVDEGYDAKVFTLATLVGAHVVYNTVKVIDQQAVGLLETLVQRAQLFRTRSAAGTASNEEAPDFLRREGFPPMTWVVEDFVQELPERFREEGATGWLRTYLEGSGPQGSVEMTPSDSEDTGLDEASRVQGKSDFLSKVFRDVRVHTLFLPATGRDQLRDLSRLRWDDLTDEFRTEIGDLRRHLLSGLQARQAGGKDATGASLARAMQFIVRGLQQGMFHELPSLWGTWATQVAAVSLSDAEAWFAALTQRLDAGDEPVAISTFNDRLDEARNAATTFYRALLRDFNVRPEVGELRRRMEVHLRERLLPTYHERLRRWVAEQIALSKANFSGSLEQQVLPMEPAKLEKSSLQVIESVQKAFVAQLTRFSALGSGRKLSAATGANGLVVQMPALNPDPAVQLSADLRTMLGAKGLENERAVQHLFKQAVQAADEAVAREVRAVVGGAAADVESLAGSSSSVTAPLLSRGKVKALQALAEQRGWRAFEERLAPYSWAKSVSHHRASRALVQAEYLDARLNAFIAANEQRLRAYFSAALDRALGTYVANRSTIVMPAAEADVEADHSQLASWAQEVLSGAVKELTDTDAFSEARKRFDLAMREGLQQVKEKNVEVWKAYSDEATRCAVAANRARERQCGMFCLFSNIPWAHQITSRRNLIDCLAKSSVGSRMAAPLQAQVFEAWYKKDMGSDVQRVRMRFYSLLGTLAALAFGVWWRFRRPAPSYGGYNVYGQPQCGQFYSQAPSSGFYPSAQAVYGAAGRGAAHAAACTPMQGAPQSRYGIWRGGA
eukprot:TRINITY_DN90656_c0_g1_i1.p1 TRINITY_DN90656_c0_g1~~TRINITY_DN90656_c0_g1_i1.p1  ORF type:complete len:920 (+),score=188.62 TRINITY_DN90656_c0_g1_i1:323-2761(+)